MPFLRALFDQLSVRCIFSVVVERRFEIPKASAVGTVRGLVRGAFLVAAAIGVVIGIVYQRRR